MSRLQEARAALAAERAADEAVDRILAELDELDEAAVDRVLSRLVALLGGDVPKQGPARGNGAAVPAGTLEDLPVALVAGAKELQRLSGLPEGAVVERVMGWTEARGAEAVAEAFEAMKAERPPHEISFIEQYLGLE